MQLFVQSRTDKGPRSHARSVGDNQESGLATFNSINNATPDAPYIEPLDFTKMVVMKQYNVKNILNQGAGKMIEKGKK